MRSDQQKVNRIGVGLALLVFATALILALTDGPAQAASRSEINAKVNTALSTLYKREPGAKDLANKAKGVLVFPDIVKAGSSWPGNMATDLCARVERLRPTTVRWRRRLAFKRARNRTGTY